MGMYDTVLVASSLIDEAIKDTDIKIESFKGFCDFQTKDLDNCLTTFFIKEDGSFSWERREYKYSPPVETIDKTLSFGHLESVGEPEIVIDQRCAYIDFYDFYNTDEERIFITFTAHVKGGSLSEPIVIKNIERANLKEEQIKNKQKQDQWNKVRNTWEWRTSEFISNFRWKIRRIFQPLFSSLDKLEKNLRTNAKKRMNFSDIFDI